MKASFLILLFLGCCGGLTVKAQGEITQIERIELNGRAVKTHYRVYIKANGAWILAQRIATGFVLPLDVRQEKQVRVLILFGAHRLEFSGVDISKFSEAWVVGLETKCFSDEFGSPEEAKGVKRRYYIKFHGDDIGSVLLVTER